MGVKNTLVGVVIASLAAGGCVNTLYDPLAPETAFARRKRVQIDLSQYTDGQIGRSVVKRLKPILEKGFPTLHTDIYFISLPEDSDSNEESDEVKKPSREILIYRNLGLLADEKQEFIDLFGLQLYKINKGRTLVAVPGYSEFSEKEGEKPFSPYSDGTAKSMLENYVARAVSGIVVDKDLRSDSNLAPAIEKIDAGTRNRRNRRKENNGNERYAGWVSDDTPGYASFVSQKNSFRGATGEQKFEMVYTLLRDAEAARSLGYLEKARAANRGDVDRVLGKHLKILVRSRAERR
ncbi:hypothetical protein GOV06_03715 [Candidatus Woesearchaeota archaeon]|nr:hypothetical protein [Candidatus Woesearchaeota archaeon]